MDSIKQGDTGLDCRVMADRMKAYTMAAGHTLVPLRRNEVDGRWYSRRGAGVDSERGSGEWGAGKNTWQTTEEAVGVAG